VYALSLTSDATIPDRVEHAVKVLPGFKTDYYFAQISDTHLPTHALSSGGVIDVTDTTGMGDFDAVIEDLNVIHPEFILHSGDLVNEGELEEYLGMYEMGRAQGMLSRLRDPVFVSTGNHDIGGWGATLPPDGTSRKDWWRYFGWPWLLSPPAGDPYHSQDFTFDYGPLHVIGLEAYINNGSYDHYRQDIWGAQSFTAEQMAWLQADIAAQPPGTKKLAFYHYDFGGTLGNGSPGANFSQINPAALGLDAAIWGHNHVVAEGSLSARPINLGLRSVIDGRDACRGRDLGRTHGLDGAGVERRERRHALRALAERQQPLWRDLGPRARPVRDGRPRLDVHRHGRLDRADDSRGRRGARLRGLRHPRQGHLDGDRAGERAGCRRRPRTRGRALARRERESVPAWLVAARPALDVAPRRARDAGRARPPGPARGDARTRRRSAGRTSRALGRPQRSGRARAPGDVSRAPAQWSREPRAPARARAVAGSRGQAPASPRTALNAASTSRSSFMRPAERRA
jgi:hypothetical protein